MFHATLNKSKQYSLGRFYCLLILFCIAVGSYAQNVTGIVCDSLHREAIGYASVRLLNIKDSTYIKGAVTSSNGKFTISQSKGDYIIDISYMTNTRYTKKIRLEDKQTLDLGTIYLGEASYMLGEAVVVAPVPDIVVKGDTIEYNADAYRVGEDALLLDLVRKMPGIDISSDGKLMANGKVISKILIDGKEFFGNDIDLALKNLPASMINKLQLFKEQSEMSRVTGFNDGTAEQVLNLTVKEALKQSVFGEGRSGYGTDGRYSNKLNAHYMLDDNQYSLIANYKNITDDFEYSGASSQYDGITKNGEVGFNFNALKSEKINVGGSLHYDNNNNVFEMDSNTKTFIETGNRLSTQSSATQSIKRDLSLGLNMKWTPDSLTTIYARMNVNTGTSDDIRHSTNFSYVQGLQDTTSGWTDYKTSGDTHNLNASLIFGRRLNSAGRTISASLNGATRGGTSYGTNYSPVFYQASNKTTVIDQELSINNTGNNWGVMVSYVEPVTKHNSVKVAYTYRRDYSDRNRLTFRRDGEGEYTIVDTAFTRKTTSDYITQRINVGFQSAMEKYEYNIGFNVDPSISSSKTTMQDSIIENQKQNVVNFSPTFKFTYTPKNNITFDFDYYGSTEQPTLKQISSDTIIIDALNRTYGNMDLKPSFDNTFSMYFQKSNYEKGSFFMITGGGNYIFNKIVDYTTIDEFGNVESTYRNVSGNWGLNGGIMFNTPLRNKKFTVDNSSFGYFVRNIGYSNSVKSVTYNLTMSESFSISYRSDKFDQRLQANISYNITRNNLPNQEGMNTSNYGLKSSTLWKLPYDIAIQNEISFTYNKGYAENFQKSELLWNLSVAKQFLKKKQATAKFQCYDILDDRNNLMRVVSGNYISDTRTNMIGQYFMFSFGYRFNITNKSARNAADAQSADDYN